MGFLDTVTKPEKKGNTVLPSSGKSSFLSGIKVEKTTTVKPPVISPAPTVTAPVKELTYAQKRVEETRKGVKPPIMAIGETINKLTARPDYEKRPASKSSWLNTLRELPASFIETILPGVKAIRDDEELASTITNKDLLKEVPGAVVQTGKEFIKAPISGALEIPNLATAGRYQPEISFNIPGLGEVSNSDFKIARRVEQGEDPLVAVLSEKSTGLLNTLFFVSLATRPFMPRQVSVTGKVKAPEGIEVKTGPKSFRLYQPPTASKPLTPEFITKMQADGINLGPRFDPASPTYFRLSSSGMGNVYGEVIQIKPSYFNTFMKMFKGDTSAMPKAQVNVLNEQKVNVNEIKKVNVLENKNYQAPNVDQTIKGHIAEAVDTVNSGVAKPTEAIARAKINIVDGIKTLAPTESARIAKIDVTGMTSLAQFQDAIFPPKTPVNIPIMPPVIKPSEFLNKVTVPPVKIPEAPKIEISKTIENLPQEIQDQAQTDWEDNYAEKYGEVSGTFSQLQNELKTTPVAQQGPIKTGINKALNEMLRMENDFVDKYQNIKTPREAMEDSLILPKLEGGGDGKVVKVNSLGKEGYVPLVENYKGKQIVMTGDNFSVWDPDNKTLFVVALDDSKMTGSRFINKEANTVEGARKYIDWVTKPRNKTVEAPQEVKTAPETKDEVIHTLNNLPDGQEPPANRIEVPSTGTFNDFSYSPETNSVYKEVNNRWNEMKLEDDITGDYDFVNLRRLAKEDNLARFDKDIKSVSRNFAKEVYAIYKAKYREYPVGFLTLSDSFVDWKQKKITYDISQAETDTMQEYDATTINEILEDLHALGKRGRSSEIIQSDIQYEVEGTRPQEKEILTPKEKMAILDEATKRGLSGRGAEALAKKYVANKKEVDITDIKLKRRTFLERAEKIKSLELSDALKNQIGNVFEVVEPVGSLWQSKGNTLFISQIKERQGFIDLLRQKNYIESADEAGNNVIRIVIKPDLLLKTPEEIKKLDEKNAQTAKEMWGLEDEPEIPKKEEPKPTLGQKAKTIPQSEMTLEEKKIREAISQDIKGGDGISPLDSLVNDLISGNIKIGVSKTGKSASEQRQLLEGYGYFRFFKDDKNLQTLDQLVEELRNKGVEIGEPNDILEALKEEIDRRKLPAYRGGSSGANIGVFDNEIPIQAGKLEEINPIELPEMVDLARELMGVAPRIRRNIGKKLGYFKGGGAGSITLKADLFNPDAYTPDQVAKTLAHEIGHLVDYLPDQTLKRGNLLGRLLSLNEFRKNFFEDIMASNKELRDEMYALSKEWRPFDEAGSSESYVKYRKSGKEIYADTISALFNSPGYVEQKAPKFYKTFFEELDRKPTVRDAYFELQSLLSGDKELLTAKRREGVKKMFDEGEYKSSELQAKREAEKKTRMKDLYARLKYDLVSKNYPLIDKVKALEKQGIKINPDDNPVYYLEERNYIGGKIKAILSRDFDPIYNKLQTAGISWEDFGEALFYKRIIDGDRSKVANPRGITPEVAKSLYEDVKKNLGDKVNFLEESLVDFREKMLSIAEEAYREGLYSPELYQQMKDNPTYATFQVIDHIEDGLTSKVYKSIGTLKDITNPATATIEKMIKTVQAIERNKVNRTTVDFLKTNYGTEITPAKSVFAGKGRKFIESKKQDEELITFMRGGKAEGYYVDPYIAKTLNNESIGQNLAVIQGLRFMNSHLYRPLFITYNLGFQSFNLIRDFMRFWKNVPGISMWRALKRYKQATKIAKVRAFGLPKNPTPADLEAEALIEKLEFDRIFSVTMNDMLAEEMSQDKQIKKVFAKYGVNPIRNLDDGLLVKGGRKLLEIVRELGDLIEGIPKVAGYYELSSRGPITKEDASFIRRKIGSPDFLDGGYAKPITNEVFLFSNAILQGMRADLEIATEPKTRGGYWWKTAKVSFLPKILMFAASLGLFGKVVKDMMDSASEYDKTNYIVVPLGKDKNNKAVYLRLPQDETGRFLGGMFWKILNAGRNDQGIGKDITDVISYTGGQLPGISPVLESLSATMQFVSGQNPYDFFRSRNILSEDVYNAGGWEATKDFLGWQFQQMGGGIFGNFFNGSQTPIDKSIPEKVFTAPIVSNILGRFIKVSNYGKTEVYRQIQDQYKQMDARQRLEEKDTAKTYAEMVTKGDKTAVEANNQMVIDVFGGEPKTADDIAKAKRLVNRLKLNLIRGEQDPLISSITYATTNKEKVALLLKAKETMEFTLFVDLLKEMYADKIIGDTVLEGLSNEK